MSSVTHRRRVPAAVCALLLGWATAVQADAIALSGTLDMGLSGTSQTGSDPRVTLLGDLDLRMRLSRTTDNGLTIALEFDLDDLVGTGSSGVGGHADPFGPGGH